MLDHVTSHVASHVASHVISHVANALLTRKILSFQAVPRPTTYTVPTPSEDVYIISMYISIIAIIY